MNKYYLTKTSSGSKFLYQIKERKTGKVVASRFFKDDKYVAATSDGDFFFGRLDLVGKGMHGKLIKRFGAILENPRKVYEEMVPIGERKGYPFEKWVSQFGGEYAQKRFNELNEIAYL